MEQITEITTFKGVIEAFGSPAEFGRQIGIPSGRAANMYQRDSIAADYFEGIAEAATRMGRAEITTALLCKIAAKRRKPAVMGVAS